MKPAAFDIVITMGILLYLAAFYLVIRVRREEDLRHFEYLK